MRTYRLRPDVPLIIDGKAAKYLSPRGVGNDARIMDILSDDWQTVSAIAEAIDVSKPTARTAMARLVKLGVAEEEPSGQAKLYRRAQRPETGKF